MVWNEDINYILFILVNIYRIIILKNVEGGKMGF